MPYFDYAASTPLDPRVREAVDDAASLVGNPSSLHAAGRELRRAVDASRARVAALLRVDPTEIIFTSGATESNNLALAGLFASIRARFPGRPLRALVSSLEHSSAREPLLRLSREHDIAVDELPVYRDGRVRAEDIGRILAHDTALVCVMWANNVLGTLQPIAEIGERVAAFRAERAKTPGAAPLVFFCDAVQAAATIDVRPRDVGADLLSLSAHKMYGPKGVGALYIRRGVPLEPLITGGGQENGSRSGTENVAGIVGFGAAADILASERERDAAHAAALRRSFVETIAGASPRARPFGAGAHALPGTVFIPAWSESGDVLALKLDAAGFAVSSGSACDAGARKASNALLALGGALAERGGIRISFGRFTSKDDLQRLAEAIASIK